MPEPRPPIAIRWSLALARIADLLDGAEWTPDMLDRIAEIVRAEGFEIREPGARQ